MNYPTQDPSLPEPGYPRRRRTSLLWVALAVATIVIVALSIVVIKQFSNDTPGSPVASSTTASATRQPAPPTVPSSPDDGVVGSSMTCDGYTASVDEGSQPGWHAAINRFGLAYAAPPDWTVAACGVRSGWAKPCPAGQCVIRELGAVATVANPACPKQNLAMSGVTGSKNPDIRAALDEETALVAPIYTNGQTVPSVELSPVREFTIGTRPAVQVVATITGIAADDCTGPNAFHSMVVTTVPNVQGSVVFLISLREGATASPKPDVINEMVQTLRSPA